jgi:hypothetical protein
MTADPDFKILLGLPEEPGQAHGLEKCETPAEPGIGRSIIAADYDSVAH